MNASTDPTLSRGVFLIHSPEVSSVARKLNKMQQWWAIDSLNTASGIAAGVYWTIILLRDIVPCFAKFVPRSASLLSVSWLVYGTMGFFLSTSLEYTSRFYPHWPTNHQILGPTFWKSIPMGVVIGVGWCIIMNGRLAFIKPIANTRGRILLLRRFSGAATKLLIENYLIPRLNSFGELVLTEIPGEYTREVEPRLFARPPQPNPLLGLSGSLFTLPNFEEKYLNQPVRLQLGENWKEIISGLFSEAQLVVADVTDFSENLLWEVSEAFARCFSRQVILFFVKTQEDQTIHDSFTALSRSVENPILEVCALKSYSEEAIAASILNLCVERLGEYRLSRAEIFWIYLVWVILFLASTMLTGRPLGAQNFFWSVLFSCCGFYCAFANAINVQKTRGTIWYALK